MIIAITGKKCSGKDTVAKMIQYYMFKKECPNYMKDISIEKYLKYYGSSGFDFTFSTHDNYFEIKKFATKLKQICAILLGCKVEDFESEKFKDSYSNQINLTNRSVLQKVGTQMKENFGQDFWINSLFEEYKGLCSTEKGAKIQYPNWIISDLRFLNEADEIKERNGIIIKICRQSLKEEDNHISETELDLIKYDHYIQNSGTIENLYDKVKTILDELSNTSFSS